MAFRLGANSTNNVRQAATNAIVGALNTGTTNTAAQLLIYSGSQPATPETAATGTLLATVPFANPAFATSDATGTSALAGGASITATVTTSGTAGWFRVVDRNNNPMFDGSIAQGSGGDMNFNNTGFVTGGQVTVTAMTIQTPM